MAKDDTRQGDTAEALKKMPGKDIQTFIRLALKELDTRAMKAMMVLLQKYVDNREALSKPAVILKPEEEARSITIRCEVTEWKVASALATLADKELQMASITRHITINESDAGIVVLHSFRTRPTGLDFIHADLAPDETELSVSECLEVIKQRENKDDD